MGLFDYIHSEYPLPSCPQALIDRWGKSVGDIEFQTKDTPDQCMTTILIRYITDAMNPTAKTIDN